MHFRETARAKVNLTLSVLGRRPDGYHEIESLVAFAEIGDRLTFSPGPECSVATSGPFAGDIEGRNLLEMALELLCELDAGLQLGTVLLEKHLPVAAGLGGGSADAAALLRAVRRANPERTGSVAWHAVAARLGADVPVCLAGTPALISGIGDRIEPLGAAPGLPSMAAVLVNPRQLLATAQVYQALAASSPSPRTSRGEGRGPHPRIKSGAGSNPLPTEAWGEGTDTAHSASVGPFPDLAALVAYLRARGNDLERPAISLLQVIADMKAALIAQPECLYAAMSGSGPTCFGLFADDASAARAATTLARLNSLWWIVATRLGGGLDLLSSSG
jgi:4-diphosphocytidyl-2-C-methyl-D-erythritol kinase